jgi:multimeric flavodoxin WrbA
MADGGRDVARSMINADLAVLLTSITFGGRSSELEEALDRTICLVSPFFARLGGGCTTAAALREVPGADRRRRATMRGAAPEEERSFTTLVSRNAINFHAPLYASGVIYTNQSAEAARECLDDLRACA